MFLLIHQPEWTSQIFIIHVSFIFYVRIFTDIIYSDNNERRDRGVQVLRFHSRLDIENLILNPNLLPINFLVLLIIQFWSDGFLYSFLSLAQSELFTWHGRPEIVGHNLRRLEGNRNISTLFTRTLSFQWKQTRL